MEATVDIERILQIARKAKPFVAPEPILFTGQKQDSVVTLAIARDNAFNFYYPENLELLQWHGAHLVEFHPLDGEPVPDDADGVYIGGGFPEEFASTLSQHTQVSISLRRAVQNGMPVFAECGGFMYLTEAIQDRQGDTHPMTGIIKATVTMQSRVAALGYREVTAHQDTLLLSAGERARGHEFHYSTVTYQRPETWPHAYETVGLRGASLEGYAQDNLLAGYTHLHFASNPRMVERFITACRVYKESQTTASPS